MSRRFTMVSLVLPAAIACLIGVISAGGMVRSPTGEDARSPGTPLAGSRTAGVARTISGADVVARVDAAVVNSDATSRTLERTVTATLEERVSRMDDVRDRPASREFAPQAVQSPPAGLSVRDLDRRARDRLAHRGVGSGVLIARVGPMSSSFDGSIERDRVLQSKTVRVEDR